MDPSRQVIEAVGQHEKWYDDVPDNHDSQIGRQIVGTDMAEVLSTVRASLHRLQIEAEQWRAVEVWAVLAISPLDRISFRNLIDIRQYGHPSRALES